MNRMTAIACLVLLLPAARTSVAGVCAPLGATSENVVTYGLDYRPRLDFHAPDELSPCSSTPQLEGVQEFTLYAWNVGLGIEGAKFRIVSNGNILEFLPAADFIDMGGAAARPHDELGTLDLNLTGPLTCGPLALGVARVEPDSATTSLFVELAGYGGSGLPVVRDDEGLDLPAVAPYHGAYAGELDLYHCQPPLCAEPLAPIRDLTAVQSGGSVIELGWTCGDGDVTIIRYRDDGVYPSSLYDGQELVRFPTQPGAWQTIVHVNPDVPRYWYTAFNVRLDGQDLDQGSRLDCGSFVEASVDESIENENMSWSAIKYRYR